MTLSDLCIRAVGRLGVQTNDQTVETKDGSEGGRASEEA